MAEATNPPTDNVSQKEARQLSDYAEIQHFPLAKDTLTVEQRQVMARYIARYGNLLPKSLQTEGRKEAFTTEQVVKAYYVSDAYAQRARRSLGYLPGQQMTANDKAVYDRIIERGRNADIISVVHDPSLYEHESYFFDIKEDIAPIEPGMEVDNYEEHSAYIGTKPPLQGSEHVSSLGMNTLAHEMGHFLYTGHDDDLSLNPGARGKSNYMGIKEEAYGRAGSPLRTINASASRSDALRTNLKAFSEECTAEEKADMQKDNYHAAIQSSREHDDSGMERGADVHGVRMLMMQEGLWNFFSGKRVTLPQVLQFQKEHPTSRVFQYWTPQQVVYYLNNIAKVESIPSKDSIHTMGTLDVAALSSSIFEKMMEEQTSSQSLYQGRT